MYRVPPRGMDLCEMRNVEKLWITEIVLRLIGHSMPGHNLLRNKNVLVTKGFQVLLLCILLSILLLWLL